MLIKYSTILTIQCLYSIAPLYNLSPVNSYLIQYVLLKQISIRYRYYVEYFPINEILFITFFVSYSICIIPTDFNLLSLLC
jgi:hypothetical protein